MSEEKGFLTKTDREFLTGEKEYTGENAKQQRYERREAIAKRTRQAFHDFALLNDVLDEHERNRIFDPDEREVVDLLQALRETIAFLYRTLEGDMEPGPFDRSFDHNFNEVFEPGVKKGEIARLPLDERKKDRFLSAYGYVEYEPFEVKYHRNPPVPDPDAVVDRLVDEGARGLSDGELRALVHRATRETVSPEPASEPDSFERFDLHTLADRVADRAAERGQEPSADDDDE